jgi:hypothetical protein
VFVAVNDPLGPGIVQSFSHPGGNATGETRYLAVCRSQVAALAIRYSLPAPLVNLPLLEDWRVMARTSTMGFDFPPCPPRRGTEQAALSRASPVRGLRGHSDSRQDEALNEPETRSRMAGAEPSKRERTDTAPGRFDITSARMT